MVEWINNHWLEIAVFGFIIGNTVYCHYKGFLHTALSLCAVVLSLMITGFVSPVVSNLLLRSGIGGEAGSAAFKVICFIAVFILSRVVIGLLIRTADLVAKLPVLHGLNQMAGAVLGLAVSLIFVWLGGLLIAGCSTFSWAEPFAAQIEASPALTWLQNNNMILNMARGALEAAAKQIIQ